MGIINRFLTFVISLAMIMAAAAGFVLCLGVLPEASWLPQLRSILARPEAPAVAVLLVVVSLIMLLRALVGAGGPAQVSEIVIKSSHDGDVGVAVAAIRSLVLETVCAIRGINGAEVNISVPRPRKNMAAVPLAVSLRLIVHADVSVPEITDQVVSRLNEKFATVLSLTDVPIKVSVGEITNSPAKRERRVV